MNSMANLLWSLSEIQLKVYIAPFHDFNGKSTMFSFINSLASVLCSLPEIQLQVYLALFHDLMASLLGFLL